MKALNSSILCVLASSLIFFSCIKTQPVHPKKPPVVDAGPTQTITLPVDTVVLTGKVLDSTSQIKGYLWSEVSGPNAALISNDGARSTVVSGLVPGEYVFQFMATDVNGLTGLDTMAVFVISSIKTGGSVDTIAPVHNPYELTYIGNTSLGLNYTASQYPSELGAEYWTINSQPVAVRSVFRFDLSAVSSATINSAHLVLFSNPTPTTGNLTTPNYGSSNAFYIQRVSTSWSPTGATWNTQPSIDTTAEVLVPQTNQSTLDLNVDVTQLVKNIIASGNNYGFEIRLQTEVTYNSRIFCSSSYSDSTKRPQLVINHQ